MICRRIFVLFFLLIFISFSVYAESLDSFKSRSEQVFENVESNFSLPEVSLYYTLVKDGSAEARRLPFKGYYLNLDYAELENASDFELKGMFAHELSHVKVYSQMNFVSLVFYGLHYQFSSAFRKKVERSTDTLAIEQGFGKELYSFRNYRLATASDSDRRILQTYYLSPEEINAFFGSSLSVN